VFGVAVAGSFVRRFIATPAIVSPQTSLAEAPVTAVVLGDERDGETLAPGAFFLSRLVVVVF